MTVERIQRQNEYHKMQIQAKIEQDNMKSKALKDQKADIMNQRRVMQKEAIVQKTKINDAFERMKSKGKMDPNIMDKLGIKTGQSQDRNMRGSIRSQSPPDNREEVRAPARQPRKRNTA